MPRPVREVPWLGTVRGVYYVHWYERESGRTKRISLGTKDAGEAQTRYALFLTQGTEIYSGRDAGRLTVEQALDDYYKEHVAVKTAAAWRQEIAITHLKKFFGTMDIADVDIALSRAYAAHRGVADATARRELVVLVAAANHAAKWKRISKDKLPSIELPTVHKDPALSDNEWYTHAELERLFQCEDDRLRRFIRIAYFTASRRAAIETLTLPQIQRVGPRNTWRINLAKPGEKRTNKRRPIVPLFREIESDIAALERETTTEYLFGRKSSFYQPFRDYCEAIGLAYKRNPHMLRHSRATHLLHDGTSIYAVAKLLGDTVSTVERVYGHHSVEFLSDTLDSKVSVVR